MTAESQPHPVLRGRAPSMTGGASGDARGPPLPDRARRRRAARPGPGRHPAPRLRWRAPSLGAREAPAPRAASSEGLARAAGPRRRLRSVPGRARPAGRLRTFPTPSPRRRWPGRTALGLDTPRCPGGATDAGSTTYSTTRRPGGAFGGSMPPGIATPGRPSTPSPAGSSPARCAAARRPDGRCVARRCPDAGGRLRAAGRLDPGVGGLALDAARVRPPSPRRVRRSNPLRLPAGRRTRTVRRRRHAVAEAVVWRDSRGLRGGFPDASSTPGRGPEPTWTGRPRSDLQAWWMQTLSAVRNHPPGARWQGLYREALDEALEVAPPGRIGGGWYAERGHPDRLRGAGAGRGARRGPARFRAWRTGTRWTAGDYTVG